MQGTSWYDHVMARAKRSSIVDRVRWVADRMGLDLEVRGLPFGRGVVVGDVTLRRIVKCGRESWTIEKQGRSSDPTTLPVAMAELWQRVRTTQ